MGKSIRNIAAVTLVGLDLAKNVLQVHGVDGRDEVVVVRKLRRGGVLEFFRSAVAVRRGDGGLRKRTSLGP